MSSQYPAAETPIGKALALAEKSLPRFVRKSEYKVALGEISDSTFHRLRAAGIVGDPIELSPGLKVWPCVEVDATLARIAEMPRSKLGAHGTNNPHGRPRKAQSRTQSDQ